MRDHERRAHKSKSCFTEKQIAERVTTLAAEIAAAKPKDLLVVAILKGSFMFAADLLRAMHRAGLEPHVEFFHLSSYREGTVSSGTVTILRDIESAVKDRDVVLIDDILESGRTLAFAKDLLVARGARRVLVCTLLEKPRQARGADHRRFRRLRLPRRFRRRLRHGCRPFLSRTAVHRPRRHRGRPPVSARPAKFVAPLPELRRDRRSGARRDARRGAARRARGARTRRVRRRRAPTSIRTNTCRAGAERLLWLTGFSGSAGLAIVLADKAALVRRRPLHAAGAGAGRRLGLHSRARRRRAADGLDRGEPRRGRQARLRSLAAHAGIGRTAVRKACRAAGGELVAGRDQSDRRDLDATVRAPPLAPIHAHPERLAGETRVGQARSASARR